jgi:hypothetical protein
MILLPAHLSARLPRLEFLGKYREPGILLAAGFLAGMVLFLLWLAFLPGTGKDAAGVPASGSAAAAQKPLGDANGVLNDITGELEPRSAQIQSGAEAGIDQQASAGDPGMDAEAGDDDAAASGRPPGDEGDQLSGGLLDEPAPAPEPAGPLQTWYVEVMREPGMTEYLQINAESAEHARSILRDYRGDPEIIRGPSIRPLD